MGGFLADLFLVQKARFLTSKNQFPRSLRAWDHKEQKELDFEMEACDSHSSPGRQQFCACPTFAGTGQEE